MAKRKSKTIKRGKRDGNAGAVALRAMEKHNLKKKIAQMRVDERLNATEIADRLGMAPQSVGKLVAEIETAFFDEMHEDTQLRKVRLSKAHETVLRMSRDAWQESKLATEMKPAKVTVSRDSAGGEVRETEYAEVLVPKSGDPAHLRNALTALKALRDIWGVDEPKQTNTNVAGHITAEVTHVDADDLTDNDLAQIIEGDFTVLEDGQTEVGGKRIVAPQDGEEQAP